MDIMHERDNKILLIFVVHDVSLNYQMGQMLFILYIGRQKIMHICFLLNLIFNENVIYFLLGHLKKNIILKVVLPNNPLLFNSIIFLLS